MKKALRKNFEFFAIYHTIRTLKSCYFNLYSKWRFLSQIEQVDLSDRGKTVFNATFNLFSKNVGVALIFYCIVLISTA